MKKAIIKIAIVGSIVGVLLGLSSIPMLAQEPVIVDMGELQEGEVHLDGVIFNLDVTAILDHFWENNPNYDLDRNGLVYNIDVTMCLNNFWKAEPYEVL